MGSTLEGSLPHDVIFDEILAKFPVKFLVRLKTVCRSWYATISSPEFAKKHLRFSSSRQVFLIETAHSYDGPYCPRPLNLLPYKEFDNTFDICGLKELNCKICPKSREILNLVDCCNGIICFSLCSKEYRVKKYILWNPAIHEYREIDNNLFKKFEAKRLGFGYVSSTGDYKIAAIYYDSKEKVNNVYLYSLKTGTWKRIVAGIARDKISVCSREHSLFYEGTIYWRSLKTFVSIDLGTEKWEESLRNRFDEYKYADLFVSQQRLAFMGGVFGNLGRSYFDVWMMDKAGDWNSWRKVSTVSLGHQMTFLDVSENGLYLTHENDDRLDFVDPTDNTTLKSFYFSKSPTRVVKTKFYFDTLISPFT